MAVVTARIDSRIHVRLDEIPLELADQIRGFLTIPNGAKIKALELKQFGAEDMPDEIVLWGQRNGVMSLPRGFASTLRAGMKAAGHELVWDDRTVAPALPLSYTIGLSYPTLHADQEPSARSILAHRQGVLQAPTGGGKTVISLDTWRRTGTTGLILTEKSSLLKQWQSEAKKHLGVDAGVIGGGEWNEQPLTIAMVQTLYARLEQLVHDGFFRRWGFAVFDEAHHAIADTYRQIIEQIVSRYLVGPTATPLEGEWEKPILEALIGPIIHVVSPEALRRQGRRVTPLIQVVRTDFTWKPSEQEAKLQDPRAIFRHIKAAMIVDDERQRLICRRILGQDESCAQLVIGSELAYLKHIHERLIAFGYPADQVFMMTGRTKVAVREEIRQRLDKGSCVLISTVADEGFDAPRLDRLHLVWPGRKARPLTQKIGRVLRQHEDKTETIIFDYADLQQQTYRSQFYARMQVYRAAGYPVDGV